MAADGSLEVFNNQNHKRMYNNFSEGMTYDFSEADYAFIRELSKIGYVKLSSSQVTLLDPYAGTKHEHSFSFKKHAIGDGKSCKGLKLPDNWAIECISGSEEKLSITFAVSKM